jgi:hypothetical protein
VERPLKNFEVDISYRISEISDALQSLMKNINDLKELARIKEETGMKVKVKECLLRLSLIDGIRLEGGRQAKSTKGFLSAFVENIYNHDEYIRSFKEKIENIEKSLEKFENVIKEIGDQSKLLENANITHDELMVSIKYDLSLLSEMRIYEMDQYIENIYEIINTMVTKLKSFENEILKHSDPRMERFISKILSDVYGG